MDGAREHVFARARFAFEQHAGVRGRDALEHAEDGAHGDAVAERLTEQRRLARQHHRLARLHAQAEVDAADADGRSGLDDGLVHCRATDARLVGRPEVTHEDALRAAFELAVQPGDGVVLQDEIVLGRLANAQAVDEPHLLPALCAVQDDDDDLVWQPHVETLGARADF